MQYLKDGDVLVLLSSQKNGKGRLKKFIDVLTSITCLHLILISQLLLWIPTRDVTLK